MKAANNLIYLFLDVPMYKSHRGLTEIFQNAAKGKSLQKGEVVLFINRKWTRLKLLTSDNVILYLAQPDNRPINPKTIQYLPACVNGNEINYNKALSKVLNDDFKKKGFEKWNLK